jgi:transposase-like protein
MTADMQNPIFNDEDKAREALEAVRWPDGPICPHCGSYENIAKVEGMKHSHRPGLYYCNGCRGQFTVTVGSVFERSKVPLTKWWLAVYLMSSSKKGVSAHQLFRSLGLGSYRTAWFMAHRIREAMRDGFLSSPPLGGKGKIVEADETFIGRKPGRKKVRGWGHKQAVLTLVERGGKARSFHLSNTSVDVVLPVVRANIAKESRLATDEAGQYKTIGGFFPEHLTVNHSQEEYVKGDASTNTVEGYFSVFKRGMTGIYQHCGEKHLHRYLAEFDFRYNNREALGVGDAERTRNAMAGIEGKRLTYRRSRLRTH